MMWATWVYKDEPQAVALGFFCVLELSFQQAIAPDELMG